MITPSLFNRMLKDIADEAEKALVMEAVLRSQTQAYYGPQNAGHFGLALGSYAHFTSPIRRYADLLVHRALVDAFELEQPAAQGRAAARAAACPSATAPTCRKVTDAISQTERRAMEAERDTIDRYVAAWLSGRVGEVFPTRITGVQSFGFFATIVGLGGDGLVPVSTLGARVLPLRRGGAGAGRRATAARATRSATSSSCGSAEANPLTGALKFEVPTATARRSSRAARGRSRRRAAQAPAGPARPAGQHPPPGARKQAPGRRRCDRLSLERHQGSPLT